MREICSELNGNRPLVVRAVFSSPDAGAEYTRIVLRPVSVKGGDGWQAERFSGVKVFHLNLTAAELSGRSPSPKRGARLPIPSARAADIRYR